MPSGRPAMVPITMAAAEISRLKRKPLSNSGDHTQSTSRAVRWPPAVVAALAAEAIRHNVTSSRSVRMGGKSTMAWGLLAAALAGCPSAPPADTDAPTPVDTDEDTDAPIDPPPPTPPDPVPQPCDPALALDPPTSFVPVGSSAQLVASGGTGAWAFVVSGPGTVNPADGAFFAGDLPGEATVTLTDAGCIGQATATVTVTPTLQIAPEHGVVAPGTSFAFDVTGGSGTGGLVDVRDVDVIGLIAQSAQVGSGCPGSFLPSPVLTGGLPHLGLNLGMVLINLPLDLGVFVFSLAPGLSLDLGFLGAPGCTLYQSPDLVATVFGSGGTANCTLPIPNSPALIGVGVRAQGLSLDPLANALGLTTSNGLVATIGW